MLKGEAGGVRPFPQFLNGEGSLFFSQKRVAVRFYLKANGEEAELSVNKGEDGESLTTILHLPEGGTRERRFVLSGGAAHELCEDGSFRRFGLLAGSPDPRRWSFFHSGRVRTVHPVGGVAGRVESLQSEGSVNAPMNGQVVKITKAVGDRVESGEVVLILEAMKMENEVTAPRAGVVSELRVEAGQTVGPGQLLFSVESAE